MAHRRVAGGCRNSGKTLFNKARLLLAESQLSGLRFQFG
jgi:hypothetical protein